MSDCKSKSWVFTLNNWTIEEDDFLKEKGSDNAYGHLCYGYETSSTGTPHLQGMVTFRTAIKMASVKRQMGTIRPYLHVMDGRPEQARAYCIKSGVFQEYGEMPIGQGRRSDLDRFFEWCEQEENADVDMRTLAIRWPRIFVMYPRVLEWLHIVHPRIVSQPGELRGWQLNLENQLINGETNDRDICFVVDPEGGKGKSWFQRYMLARYPDRVQTLAVARRDDLAYTLDEEKDIFLLNVTRGAMEFISYPLLEQLKDRYVFSGKYQSRTKIWIKQPMIVIFSNEDPDFSKMTSDRYNMFGNL